MSSDAHGAYWSVPIIPEQPRTIPVATSNCRSGLRWGWTG